MKKRTGSGSRSAPQAAEPEATRTHAQPRLADDRANQLLKIFCEIEEYEGKLSEAQFSELLYRAALACGFVDAQDAWQALTEPNLAERRHFSSPKAAS